MAPGEGIRKTERSTEWLQVGWRWGKGAKKKQPERGVAWRSRAELPHVSGRDEITTVCSLVARLCLVLAFGLGFDRASTDRGVAFAFYGRSAVDFLEAAIGDFTLALGFLLRLFLGIVVVLLLVFAAKSVDFFSRSSSRAAT